MVRVRRGPSPPCRAQMGILRKDWGPEQTKNWRRNGRPQGTKKKTRRVKCETHHVTFAPQRRVPPFLSFRSCSSHPATSMSARQPFRPSRPRASLPSTSAPLVAANNENVTAPESDASTRLANRKKRAQSLGGAALDDARKKAKLSLGGSTSGGLSPGKIARRKLVRFVVSAGEGGRRGADWQGSRRYRGGQS